ncbi:MAG TPA: hypothetical protein VNM50_00615, partial [Chloroflexota bacterium]|nr:hypothetical protein [Chloroflexota bacterium]
MRPVAPWMLALLVCAGCSGARDAEDGSGELPGGSVTIWTDSTELFMEYPALVVGRPAKLAVHLTDLTDFSPLRSGRITLRFVPQGSGEAVVVSQDVPRLPGIFGPTVEFPQPGVYDLAIVVESPQARDSISVPGLRVYGPAEVPAGAEGEGGIVFLKEQQWRSPGFRTVFATDGVVIESFEAVGEVVPADGRAAEVAAPIGGLIEVGGAVRSPVPGQQVQSGQ